MKKPGLKSATPNDVDANALYDDAAHDLLTDVFSNPSKPNRVLIVAVARVVEAGGHDAGGNRITKYALDHIEVATPDTAEEKKLTEQIVSMHKRRTQSSTVEALQDPVEDTPLEGVEVGGALDDAV